MQPVMFTRKIASLFKNHRKKKIAALVFLAIILFMFMNRQNSDGISVNVGEVTRNNFEKSIFATGKLEIKGEQNYYAEDNTRIDEIMVNCGEKVVKGQVILKMNDDKPAIDAEKNRLVCDDIQTKIKISQSNIRLFQQDHDLSQKNYERIKALYDAGASSQKELEIAEKDMTQTREKLHVEKEATYLLLQSQLLEAQRTYEKSLEKLAKATVISPMDGLLLKLPVKKGQRVEAGTLVATIGDPEELQIETGINEADATELKRGDKVEISNNALLDSPFIGHIEYVSPVAESVKLAQGEQTQVKIRVALDKTENNTNLKPGNNVNIKIILHYKNDVLLVPYEAIVKINKKDMVYVVNKDNIVEEREVTTGFSNELFFEIVSGLEAGEKVVLSPGQQIIDGVKVIVNAEN